MNITDKSSGNNPTKSQSTSVQIALPDGATYWADYQNGQRRKFLKQLHPFMLRESGYITTEGTKPHGKKSRGYGKGTGIQGVQVFWDKHYALEKIKYDLEAISFSMHFEEWFIGLASIYLGSSHQDKSDDISWLIEWVSQEQKKITNPDSPRQKKSAQLLDDLKSLIDEKVGDV